MSGDTCPKIASTEHISLSQFYAWNKNIGSEFKDLLLNYYIHIGVVGVRGTPERFQRTKY
jgi:hypothetical protein